MFGWSSSTCPLWPIELSRLTMLAGCACPTGLANTVLTWLGGLLPKNRGVSNFLQAGLKSFLHGNIQRPPCDQALAGVWRLVQGWRSLQRQPSGASPVCGIPATNTYDVLRLCPDWQAFTSGGPRHLRSTGAFLHPSLPDPPCPETAMTPEQMKKKFLMYRPLESAATVSTRSPSGDLGWWSFPT